MTTPAPRSRTPSAISRIVIPLDGSLLADSALRVGAAIAQRARLGVTLVQALDPGGPGRPRREADDHLRRAADRFADVADIGIVAVSGRPADVIIDAAERENALVCMASHGRGGLARLALGSVAEEVLRRDANGLVVVGPRGATFPLAGERTQMLFCTNGSQTAARAAPATAELARVLDLGVTVVQQVDPDEDVSADGSPPPCPLLDAARSNCASFQDFFTDLGVAAQTRVLFGEPARAIAHLAGSLPASLIALASHGRRGLDRYAIGSLAADLVRRAPCPLFVVGPAGTPDPPDVVESGEPRGNAP